MKGTCDESELKQIKLKKDESLLVGGMSAYNFFYNQLRARLITNMRHGRDD